MTAYEGVVLCGGASSRMGRDKTRLRMDGRSLLETALAALDGAASVVCVGDARPTSRPVTWVRESPIGEGPVPALRAGLQRVTADVVVLLAADLPLVTPSAVVDLLSGLDGRGVVAVDDGGREQWLLSAWSASDLRSADPGATRLRDVLGPLCDRRVVLPGRPWLDCDTPDEWADLRRNRGRLDHRRAR